MPVRGIHLSRYEEEGSEQLRVRKSSFARYSRPNQVRARIYIMAYWSDGLDPALELYPGPVQRS